MACARSTAVLPVAVQPSWHFMGCQTQLIVMEMGAHLGVWLMAVSCAWPCHARWHVMAAMKVKEIGGFGRVLDALCTRSPGDRHHPLPLQAGADCNAGPRGRAHRRPQLPDWCVAARHAKPFAMYTNIMSMIAT